MKKVKYGGWKNCIKLANGKVELIATTDIGPRIIRFGFPGGPNILKEFPAQMGRTGGAKWVAYGGHRFWHAPEAIPRSYAPDNRPVSYGWDGRTLALVQDVEKTTGMRKEIEITLDARKSAATILHRLVNTNLWEVEAAAWGLTVVTPGGRAIFPHEEYRPHPQYLLPARPLVLWHYTDMSDKRLIWGRKYIQFRQDAKTKTKNKIGMRNTLGWAAYTLGGVVFIKRFPFDAAGRYVDFGCNTECYTDSEILEVESIGAVTRIAPGAAIEHTERWYLFKADVRMDEASIDGILLPLVAKTKAVK